MHFLTQDHCQGLKSEEERLGGIAKLPEAVRYNEKIGN